MDDVERPTLNAISLCSGVGMLDEGLDAALGYLGFGLRHVLYAEREAYPCAVLEARMEEGSLAPAPIWCGDFTKLPAARFRGVVDGIVAGFPCQDISLAGRRDGLDGQRSGLFFDILNIADACGAWFLALENVAGISSATASVVDEAEGELYERAAARVVGELADRGWNAEWLTVRASDVGASHGRERWFCWAWREMADTSSPRREGREQRGARPDYWGGAEAHGPTEQLRRPFFAPGPADEQWPDILRRWPELAPAIEAPESRIRGVADGVARGMDDCRPQRLRCVGNGVVALQAAFGFVQLLRRAGVTCP